MIAHSTTIEIFGSEAEEQTDEKTSSNTPDSTAYIRVLHSPNYIQCVEPTCAPPSPHRSIAFSSHASWHVIAHSHTVEIFETKQDAFVNDGSSTIPPLSGVTAASSKN